MTRSHPRENSERKLERDPNYRPDFIPPSQKSAIEVDISPEVLSLLEPLGKTEQYGSSEPTMVLASFMRWCQNKVKDRVSKLSIRQ